MAVTNGAFSPKPSGLKAGETRPMITSTPRSPGCTTYVPAAAMMTMAKISKAPPASRAIAWALIAAHSAGPPSRVKPSSASQFGSIGLLGCVFRLAIPMAEKTSLSRKTL